jgi:hypothetical protein
VQHSLAGERWEDPIRRTGKKKLGTQYTLCMTQISNLGI